MIWTSFLCLSSVATALFPEFDAGLRLASRQDSSLSSAASSQSIFVPWASAFSRTSNAPPSIRGSIFNRPQIFSVDTSTTCVIVPASLVPNVKLTKQDQAGWEYMTSTQTLLAGRFKTVDLTFGSTSSSNKAVSRVLALIVTKATRCPGYDESTDHGICPANKLDPKRIRLNNIVYLGVGFGHYGPGSANPFSTPSHNAFLNIISLNGVNASSMRTGYTVSSRGVQLGLTPNNTAGAVWTSLRKTPDLDPRAWALPQVSFTADDSGESVQADALVDTSVPQMSIQSSPNLVVPNVSVNSAAQRVKPGTRLTFAFLDALRRVAGYDFVVGDTGFPSQPSAVVLVEDGSAPHVNLGRNILFGFDVLFDADEGKFGLICARCV